MPYGCFEQTSSATYPNILVLDYMRRKTSDYDRWLKGMRRMRARFMTS